MLQIQNKRYGPSPLVYEKRGENKNTSLLHAFVKNIMIPKLLLRPMKKHLLIRCK